MTRFMRVWGIVVAGYCFGAGIDFVVLGTGELRIFGLILLVGGCLNAAMLPGGSE